MTESTPFNFISEFSLKYSDEQVKTSNVLRVFDNVFYVVVEMINKVRPERVRFDAANEQLGRIYTRLTKSKSFAKKLESIGYKVKSFYEHGEVEISKIT